MALARKRIGDLETLRAFVHPLRIRLLGALRVDGPATASALGRRLGESSGSTSYHLRQLARYGFVVEDRQQPSRRERRWRAAHDFTGWRAADFLDSAAARTTLQALQRVQLQYLVDDLQRWHRAQDRWPAEWVDAAEHSDRQVWLRASELRALRDELGAVVQRYLEKQRPANDPEAARVAIHLLAYPVRGSSR